MKYPPQCVVNLSYLTWYQSNFDPPKTLIANFDPPKTLIIAPLLFFLMAVGDDSSLSLSILLHMLTINIFFINYLLCKFFLAILSYLKLSGHIDGSTVNPSLTITTNIATAPNPDCATWPHLDQRALIIIYSSIFEEALSQVLGLDDAHSVWRSLEASYIHDSVERTQTLHDSLYSLQKGNSSVTEHNHKFKNICDQLYVIGHSVDDVNKSHWFLCGLGLSFETFSTTHSAVKPCPTFHDLLSQAEGHELFLTIYSWLHSTTCCF